MTGNRHLRAELDKASLLKDWKAYCETIEALRGQYGHSIEILPLGNGRLTRFNCFAFALGLWEQHTYIEAVDKAANSAIVDSSFLKSLIESGQLAARGGNLPKLGDIAVYDDNGRITHAATVVSGEGALRLNSKWGGNEVHGHELWEVPAGYGNNVRFFAPLNVNDALSKLPTQGSGNA